MQINGGTPTTTTYNAANQITNAGFTYDNAGNLTNDGSAASTYDALNRTTARGTTTYAYNGDGTLVSQVTGGVTTRYTQDLAAPLTQVLQTKVGAATATDYLYGLNRLASLNGSTKTWYASDALGSVRRTVADNGTPLGVVNYDPWGTVEAGTVPTFGFTGEVQQGSNVYLRERWYNSQQGTFITKDPFAGWNEEPQSLAPYNYVHNNPVNYIDPTGLVRWSKQGTAPPYHDWIESRYELTNPINIHIEFDGLPGIRIDVLNDATGDVYEIKPIDELAQGFAQVTGYIGYLRLAQGFFGLNPEYRGFPKTRTIIRTYHWDQVFWGYGSPANYTPQRWQWGSANLVAMSPSPGMIAYWIEPKDARALSWNALVASNYRRELKRPYGWKPGDPIPNVNVPIPLSPSLSPSDANSLAAACTVAGAIIITGLILIDPVPGDEVLIPIVWAPVVAH